MAHFAKLGKGNIVERVEVVTNDIATTEQAGVDFLKSLYGNEAYDAVANLVSKEYTDVLSKMQLKGAGLEALESRILETVKNAGLADDAYDVVVKRITKNITNQIKMGKE